MLKHRQSGSNAMQSGYFFKPVGNLFKSSPPPAEQERRPFFKGPDGTLYVRDTFQRSTPILGGGTRETPHGELVLKAADDVGVDVPKAPSIQDEPWTPTPSPNSAQRKNIRDKTLTKEQVLKQTAKSIESDVTRFLDDQSNYLERATKSGVKNSAVNFSLGTSKASLTQGLFDEVMSSIGAEGKAGENYARAFGFDLEKIKSKDPKVRGPELRKLQQAIIKHVSSTLDNNKKIGASIDRWDDAVEAFEKGKNSVIISAGNEGRHEELLEKDNGGKQLDVPDDFETNLLENDLVTSVGATEKGPNGKQKRAEYSSESGGVDIYANGEIRDAAAQKKKQGTSFSAPRIAALMARLHKQYPHLSSAQIETLVKQRFTQKTDGVPVLKSDINLDHLKKRTY